jgi:hypothetical protein
MTEPTDAEKALVEKRHEAMCILNGFLSDCAVDGCH